MAPAPILPLMLPLLFLLMPRDESSTAPPTISGAPDTEREVIINVAGPTVHVGSYHGDTHGAQAITTNTNQQIATTSTQVQTALLDHLNTILGEQETNMTTLDQDLQPDEPKSRQRRTAIMPLSHLYLLREPRPAWLRYEILCDFKRQWNLTQIPSNICDQNALSLERLAFNLTNPETTTTIPSLETKAEHHPTQRSPDRDDCDLLCVTPPCPCIKTPPHAISVNGVLISYHPRQPKDRSDHMNLTTTPPISYGLNVTSKEKELSDLLRSFNISNVPSLTSSDRLKPADPLYIRRKCDIYCRRPPCPCIRRGPPYGAFKNGWIFSRRRREAQAKILQQPSKATESLTPSTSHGSEAITSSSEAASSQTEEASRIGRPKPVGPPRPLGRSYD